MKVIVFGGSGFLGSHVSDALTDAGYEVRIFDIKHSPYLKASQKMIIGDIMDTKQVLEAVKDCKYAYNFAGIADLDDATTKPLETLRLNIEGTINILEACIQAKIKRFVYASSVYVYSEKGGFYRCSKQAAELYIEEYQKRYGLDYTILRYGTLYGLRADRRNSIYRYLYEALNTKKITVFGNGEELREYINVRDAAELTVKILAPEYNNKHLIITGHHPIKLKQLMETIQEILNDLIEIIYRQDVNQAHYFTTPYSYIPKIGKKLTTDCYCDLGQGLLECIGEMDKDNIRFLKIS